MSEYVGILVTFVLAATIVGAFVALASTLGPRKPSAVKSMPFECGQDPFALPIGLLSIKFYLTAILFILFDVELVFLYPLAVQLNALGWFGFVEFLVFVAILAVAYVYIWRKGALEWR